MVRQSSSQVRFDDALPRLVALIQARAPDLLGHSLVLRNALGRITLVVPEEKLDLISEDLKDAVMATLGAYAERSGVSSPNSMFDPDILASPEAFDEDVILEDGATVSVRLVDRRLIGQDWTRPNFAPIEGVPPLFSFFSCKGGVGRSTALAVAAADLARRGHNVLVVDLDLEAPGVGSMLLTPEGRPDFGALDYLVENGLGGIPVREAIAPCSLTNEGQVDVLPAVGRRSLKTFPQNVILKLGRAFLDDRGVPLASQVRDLIAVAAAVRRYDVVLVDVRAGLSEGGAAALLALGGEMLLFGVNTPQTFESYRYLFHHLRRYGLGDWRHRLHMVHAKAAPADREGRKRFLDLSYDLFLQLYDQIEPQSGTDDVFSFDLHDPDAPHAPKPIGLDAAYGEFDPISKRDLLDTSFYLASFGVFTDFVADLAAKGAMS